jgi:hypothetical protein
VRTGDPVGRPWTIGPIQPTEAMHRAARQAIAIYVPFFPTAARRGRLTWMVGSAKETRALEPKLTRVARLSARPRTRSGKISDTISHEMGPKETWEGEVECLSVSGAGTSQGYLVQQPKFKGEALRWSKFLNFTS